jgi:hypothetical protein
MNITSPQSVSMASHITFVTLLALASACTAQTGEDMGINHGSDIIVDANINEIIPTVLNLDWTTEDEGLSWVEYGTEYSFNMSTPVSTSHQTDHSMSLLGMKAGETYQYQTITELDDGTQLTSPVGTVSLDVAASGLPDFVISEDDSGSNAEGYLVVAFMQPSDAWLAIVDRDGDYVWYTQADPGQMITTPEASIDGTSIIYTQNARTQNEDTATLIRMQMDGSERTETRITMGHHDFAEHADGTLAYLGLELADATVDGQDYLVASDLISEVQEGDTTGETDTQVFSFLDSYDAPYAHELFDENAYGTGAADWTHANSLMYDPAEDVYYALSKNLSALFKIDRSSGEILWQMGGKSSDFTALENPEDTFWTHGHMSHIWDGGLMMFDNGYTDENGRAISRVVEYSFNEQSMTIEKVFEYIEPEGRTMEILGDAKKLPNGNYFTAWSTAGYVAEIDPQGNVVWKGEAELGNAVARTTWISDLYSML